jgi:hypothetical protein
LVELTDLRWAELALAVLLGASTASNQEKPISVTLIVKSDGQWLLADFFFVA